MLPGASERTLQEPLTAPAGDTLDFLPGAGEMARRVRALDWARTALGPPDAWSPSLRAAAGLCLAWSAPACIAWGSQRTLIHNDACAPILGAQDALALGRDFADSALAAEPAIADGVRRAWHGEAVCLADQAVRIGTGGRVEERLYTFALTPVRDETGAVAGVFLALTDVTPRALPAPAEVPRVAQPDVALREANRRLSAVLESVSDVFLAVDRDWRIAGINDRALQFSGRRREDVLGCDVWATFPMYRGTELETALRRAMRERQSFRHEYLGKLSARWFEISIYPSEDGLSVFGRDIDVRKRAEQRVRDSEERFVRFMEHMPGLAWLKDASGRFVYLNDASAKAWGVTRDELLGKGIDNLLSPDTNAQCRESDAAAARTPEGIQVLESYRNADGEQRHVLVSKFPIPDSAVSGALIGGIAIDVTERKHAEEALRASEARLAAELAMMERLHALTTCLLRAPDLRTGLENVLDAALAICGTDLGSVQLLNEGSGALEIIAQRGFGPEFLQHFRIVAPGDFTACARALDCARCIVVEDVEVDPGFAPHRAIAARAGFRAVQSTPLLNRDGTLLGVLSTHFREPGRPSDSTLRVIELCARYAADFVERFRIDQALRESDERLRLTLRGASAGAWRFDLATGETFWSEEFDALYGAGATAHPSHETWLERVHPDDRERVRTAFVARLKSKETEFQHEFRILHPQRGVRWILDLGRIERDAAGRATGFSGINLDITERKLAEERLRASEERFRHLSESGLISIAFFRTTGEVVEANDAFLDMVGFSREELGAGEVRWDRLTPPEWMPRTREALEEFNATGRITPYEKEYFRRDGRRFWGLFGGARLGDGGEGVAFVIDVTERRRAEQALRDSERLYRAIGESIDYGVWVCDPEGRNVYASESFLRLVGLTQEECAAFGWGKVLHPEDAERTVAAWRECVRTGGQWDIEHRYRGVDGRWHPILARGAPVRNEQGEITAWAGINLDIGRLKRIEDELRESEARFRQMADHAPVMVWVTEPDGTCTFLSKSWYAFTGQTPETGLGHGWLDAVHPQDTASALAGFKEATTKQTPFRMEYRFRRHDGVYRWGIDTAVPRFGADGRFLGMVGCVFDITERKRAEEGLHEADRRKDEFLAILAHELRNPLAPLRNGLEIMRLARDNREALEQARGLMERQLTHLVRLVDDLLDLSRITRGRVELRRERVDLAVVVRHALDTSRPLIEQAAHELSVRLPSEPVMVEADTIRLAQAIANLLNNAAKYTDRGGHIRLAVECRESTVDISVQDNGVGIPPALLPHVFDMFSRVERPLGKAHGGLGIGLSIVKHLIEMHGGTVEARSPGDGGGSEFRIRLPLLPRPGGHRSAGPADGARRDRSAGRRVLVADDNPDAVASLATLLELLGNDVRTARDGWEAVEIAAWFRPELALLDIGMPGLDGCGACRRIREQPAAKQMTIVALTGWGQEEDKRRSQAAGFDRHLVKPVEPAALERLLATLVS